VPILRAAGDHVAQFQKVSKPLLVALTRSMPVTFKPSVYRVWQLVDFHIPTLHVHALTRVARHRLLVIPTWLSHRPFSLFETDAGDVGLLLLDSGTIVRPSRLLCCNLLFPRWCLSGGGLYTSWTLNSR